MLAHTELSAGMRVTEIAALKLSDVLAAYGIIRAEIQLAPEQTKGSYAGIILISSHLKSEIEAFIRQRPDCVQDGQALLSKRAPSRHVPFCTDAARSLDGRLD
jgi:integrase/recombinase XerD